MDRVLEQAVRERASGRCEYCHLPESGLSLKHVLDHVIARQHGGDTVLENLALACGRCNQFKGPNLAGIDPETGQMVRLFHPRRDTWSDHFRFDGAIIVGITPIARATIAALAMNLPLRVAVRQSLMEAGATF